MRPLLQVVAGLLLAAAARGRAMETGTTAGGEAEPGGGGSGVVLSEYFLHPSWAATPGLGCGCLPWARSPNPLPRRAGLAGAGDTPQGPAFPSLTGAGWLQPGCPCAAGAWLARCTHVAETGCESAVGCGCCLWLLARCGQSVHRSAGCGRRTCPQRPAVPHPSCAGHALGWSALQAPAHGQSGCRGIAVLAARLILPSTCTRCCWPLASWAPLPARALPGTTRP